MVRKSIPLPYRHCCRFSCVSFRCSLLLRMSWQSRTAHIPKNVVDISNFVTVACESMLVGRTSFVVMWEYCLGTICFCSLEGVGLEEVVWLSSGHSGGPLPHHYGRPILGPVVYSCILFFLVCSCVARS